MSEQRLFFDEVSNGDTAPEWITKWYKDRGYHFVAFSEHNLLQEGEKWVSFGDRARLLKDDE